MDSTSSVNGTGSSAARRTRQPSKPAMALRFLSALSRIRRGRGSLVGRTRRIRRAAYASMARSAGPRRAWSRALLRRLLVRPCAAAAQLPAGEEERGVALRRLVPGGAAMDECELLEEAADYVRWLSTQVAVMEAVMDSVVSSSSSSS